MKNIPDNWMKILQVAGVGFALAYTTYSNARQVPQVKAELAATTIRVTVIETERQADRESIRDIKESVRRIENLLLRGRR